MKLPKLKGTSLFTLKVVVILSKIHVHGIWPHFLLFLVVSIRTKRDIKILPEKVPVKVIK